jgi:hypothetical protein
MMRLHDRLAVHDIVGVLTGWLFFTFLNLVSELVTKRARVRFLFGGPIRFHCKLSAFGLRPAAMNAAGLGHFSVPMASLRGELW